MLGDKCAWLLSMSKKLPAIDDMWLAESIKREIMLCRKEVRHLLREISCGTFYFFPISLSTRSLSLSIIWWQLWITACIKTFDRLWIQETMYLSLSERTTYFFYYSFLYNLPLWDQILCPLGIQPKNHQPLKTACNRRFSSPLLRHEMKQQVHPSHWEIKISFIIIVTKHQWKFKLSN